MPNPAAVATKVSRVAASQKRSLRSRESGGSIFAATRPQAGVQVPSAPLPWPWRREAGPPSNESPAAGAPREAAGAGGEEQVLERAAEPDVHLAVIGVDGADVARRIGEEIDPRGAHPEQPRLAVVGIGREDGRPDQRERSLARVAPPATPRLVRRPLARAPYPLLPRPPDAARGGEHGAGPAHLERCASGDLHATRQRPRRTSVVTSPLARLATRIARLLLSAMKRRPAATLTPLRFPKRSAPPAPPAWPGAPAPRSVRHSPVRGSSRLILWLYVSATKRTWPCQASPSGCCRRTLARPMPSPPPNSKSPSPTTVRIAPPGPGSTARTALASLSAT